MHHNPHICLHAVPVRWCLVDILIGEQWDCSVCVPTRVGVRLCVITRCNNDANVCGSFHNRYAEFRMLGAVVSGSLRLPPGVQSSETNTAVDRTGVFGYMKIPPDFSDATCSGEVGESMLTVRGNAKHV